MSAATRHPLSPRLDHCPEGLPRAAYLDQGWYDREMATVFARQWVMVGRASDFAAAKMRRVTVGAAEVIVVRDGAGVIGTGLPVYCQGYVAPASVAALNFVGWQETIGCGGVTVVPGDIIVADADGAVVIPQALLDAVVEAAVEQERLEAWIMDEVGKGVALPGLYPPNAETKARYEATRKG